MSTLAGETLHQEESDVVGKTAGKGSVVVVLRVMPTSPGAVIASPHSTRRAYCCSLLMHEVSGKKKAQTSEEGQPLPSS